MGEACETPVIVLMTSNIFCYNKLMLNVKWPLPQVTPKKGLWEDVVPTLEDGTFDGEWHDLYSTVNDLHLTAYIYEKKLLTCIQWWKVKSP